MKSIHFSEYSLLGFQGPSNLILQPDAKKHYPLYFRHLQQYVFFSNTCRIDKEYAEWILNINDLKLLDFEYRWVTPAFVKPDPEPEFVITQGIHFIIQQHQGFFFDFLSGDASISCDSPFLTDLLNHYRHRHIFATNSISLAFLIDRSIIDLSRIESAVLNMMKHIVPERVCIIVGQYGWELIERLCFFNSVPYRLVWPDETKTPFELLLDNASTGLLIGPENTNTPFTSQFQHHFKPSGNLFHINC